MSRNKQPGKPNWKHVCDMLPEAAIVMDDEGRIRHANRAAVELLGREPSSLIGQSCAELFHGSCTPPPDCPHLRFQTTGRSQRGDLPSSEGGLYNIAVAPFTVKSQASSGCIATLRRQAAPADAETLRRNIERLTAHVRSTELRIRHLSLLAEMEDVAQSFQNTEDLCPVLARFAEKLFPEESGMIRILNCEKSVAEPAALWGPDRPSRLAIPIQDCLALRTGRLSDSTNRRQHCAHIAETNELGALCIPLLTPYETIGTLEIRSHNLLSEPESLENGTRLRAITMAQYLGRAISSVRLRETLRLESIRDSLTGLFNRRYMQEALERELHRAGRANSPLSLIMLDIDHFKQFNDTQGHAAGDSLLRELGHLLQSRTRQEDTACRYGGEEFLLILPETPLEVALRRAESLRNEARCLKVPPITDLEGITLSLGIASYPRDGASAHDLLKCADRQLYRAKKSGRDRVASASNDHEEHVPILSSE